MREFEGKVAVVTGAASGMGRAFAEKFALEGMKVVLADYEEAALEKAVLALRQREFEVMGVVADVSSAGAVDELARRTIDAFGKVHILCNNAGVVADSELGRLGWGEGKAVWEQSLKDWHWVMGVNFFGVVNGIHAFVPGMLAHGEEGHIVNTASIAGLTSGPGLPIYSASKHAVVRLTEALHAQLAEAGSKLHASVLCPGRVTTRIALASRNKPGEMYEPGEQPPSREDLERREQEWATRPGVPGMSPEEVAGIVFEAIRDEQFWILTHDEYDPAIRARMESILARTNPETRGF